MSKITHLVATKGRYGGGIYGAYISDLKGVDTLALIKYAKKNKILKLLEYYFNLYYYMRNAKDGDTSIRNIDSSLFFSKKEKSILVFHHYHPTAKNKLLLGYQKWAYRNLVKNLDKIDILVVVSRYWQEHFESLGVDKSKIHTIYNPFEVEKYAPKPKEEIENFRKRLNLSDKPIVYIGNLQEEKGAIGVYHALKHLDIEMVASGIAHIDLPVKHFELSFGEYIMLLQLSSLSVLMSQIKEGWNRVAHESLLCRTPVIGTGYGGMGELLEGSNQTICRDFSKLPQLVEEKLKNPKVSEESYNYVALFDTNRFNKAWEEILYE